jgi:hypothetical protein
VRRNAPFVIGLFSVLISFLFSFAAIDLAKAQPASFTGTASAAMGGAGRAAVEPSESVLLNSATLPHMPNYYIAGHYFMGWDHERGNDRGFAVVISDGNPENIVPGGASFVRTNRDLTNGTHLVEQDIQVALADIVTARLSVGIAAHRFQVKESGPGLPTRQMSNQDNGKIGLLWVATDWLGFAATADDFFPSNQRVPLENRLIPTYSIGSHVMLEKMFRLRLDLVRPNYRLVSGREVSDGRVDVMAGLESYFQEKVAFRLGAQWRESTDQTLLTTGVGIKGPKLSFEYSLERDVRSPTGSRHLFDLWIPL